MSLDRSCACERCAAPRPGPRHPPGLPALRYRCGTHASFLRRALREIPRADDGTGTRPLAGLTARALDDPAVALLDAWAMVADVLTFYDERIANEGFLRTATERRSVLELARALGYELAPGLAATTHLAFLLEDAKGVPPVARVPRGTRALSAPAEGRPPQPFETDEDLLARPVWNALRPRLRLPQAVSASTQAMSLSGGDLGIRPGDALAWRAGSAWHVARVHSVEADRTPPERPGAPPVERTLVRFAASAQPAAATPPGLAEGQLATSEAPLPFTAQNARTRVFERRWREADLQAFLALHKWDEDALLAHAAARPPPEAGEAVHFAERVGFFGHNAPLWALLPEGTATRANPLIALPANDWDANPRTIRQDWRGAAYPDDEVMLERVVPGARAGDPLVVETGGSLAVHDVTRAREMTLQGFGLAARVSALRISPSASTAPVREAAAHVRPRRIPLSDVAASREIPAGATEITLDRMTLGLRPGRGVALTGETSATPGVLSGEVLELEDVLHAGGFTTLRFREGLRRGYVRATVAINANVAPASHGETVREILGGASAAQPHARYRLRRAPLAHLPTPAEPGARATLELRIGGLRWDETPSLFFSGPHDPRYELRLEDEGGVELRLGDGVRGALPPTGAENVVATYRAGGGPLGNVPAESIKVLQSRPLGVRDVINPVQAEGGSPPEPLGRARENAPLKVKTLGRVVSLLDHEDYARAFAGIGKASAVSVWSGRDRLVLLTVAASAGGPLAAGVKDNLVDALQRARHPARHVVVEDHAPRRFRLGVDVLPDPREEPEAVLARVRALLADALSFGKRHLAQPVTASEVVALVHRAQGVVACDLTALHLAEGTPSADPVQMVLPSQPGRFDATAGGLRAAELLLLDPGALDVGLLEGSA